MFLKKILISDYYDIIPLFQNPDRNKTLMFSEQTF